MAGCLALLWGAAILAAIGLGNPDRLAAAPAAATSARPTFDFKGKVRPLFEKYCVECHSGTDPEAGLDLKQMLDANGVSGQRKTWEKALSLIQLENMPPSDADQPTKAERELMQGWLDDALFYVDCRKAIDPGRVTVRDRDTMQQERVPLAELESYLASRLVGA